MNIDFLVHTYDRDCTVKAYLKILQILVVK